MFRAVLTVRVISRVGRAKDWRTDRLLRRLEALLVVADAEHSLVICGNGDVIEPDDGVTAIGSGGPYAHAAAKALTEFSSLDARAIAEEAMKIAEEAYTEVYTNHRVENRVNQILEVVNARS